MQEDSNAHSMLAEKYPTLNKKVLRLLDVGAIKNQYLRYSSWLDVTAIDLNPQHPSVIKSDFFDFVSSLGSSPSEEDSGGSKESAEGASSSSSSFDVVVLSLVMNFVGDPRKRGQMLIQCERIINDGGLLFIVLPLACVTNSRYLNQALFERMLNSTGFVIEKQKESKKLWFCVCRKVGEQTGKSERKSFKRRLCRGGTGRNNFCIILERKNSGEAEDGNDGGEEEEEYQSGELKAEKGGGLHKRKRDEDKPQNQSKSKKTSNKQTRKKKKRRK